MKGGPLEGGKGGCIGIMRHQATQQAAAAARVPAGCRPAQQSSREALGAWVAGVKLFCGVSVSHSGLRAQRSRLKCATRRACPPVYPPAPRATRPGGIDMPCPTVSHRASGNILRDMAAHLSSCVHKTEHALSPPACLPQMKCFKCGKPTWWVGRFACNHWEHPGRCLGRVQAMFALAAADPHPLKHAPDRPARARARPCAAGWGAAAT